VAAGLTPVAALCAEVALNPNARHTPAAATNTSALFLMEVPFSRLAANGSRSMVVRR
jgi:hypothetical protein